MASEFKIGDRLIGPGHPPYVVAEISANHNGDLDRAMAIMRAAREAGADAVKLQTYTPDTMTIDHDGKGFMIAEGPWAGHTLYDLYAKAQTPWQWHGDLFALGRELEITVFSTPFDETAVAFLEEFDPPAHKIASFELTDIPLLECVARTGRPVMLSTGIADEKEIETAVNAIRKAGCRQLALLHCVSGYPTPIEESNLQTIPDLAKRFGCVAGISDHTLGTASAIAAVALGASMIEKHVTLHRADGGFDSAFSLEPDELGRLCEESRLAWSALGEAGYGRKPSEETSIVFRRSLFVVKDMKEGDAFSADNIRRIRPGSGLSPEHLPEVLGRQAASDIARGTPLDWNLIKND